VDQVKANEELGLATGKVTDPVRVPDFFEKSPALGHETGCPLVRQMLRGFEGGGGLPRLL
jgi:hypothetical protein